MPKKPCKLVAAVLLYAEFIIIAMECTTLCLLSSRCAYHTYHSKYLFSIFTADGTCPQNVQVLAIKSLNGTLEIIKNPLSEVHPTLFRTEFYFRIIGLEYMGYSGNRHNVTI